jgi:hypothetical protein
LWCRYVQGRHTEEFRRLEESRAREFKNMWLGFARTQAVGLYKLLPWAWKRLVSTLEPRVEKCFFE